MNRRGQLIGLTGFAGWIIVIALILLIIAPIGIIEWFAVTKILQALSSPVIIIVAAAIFLFLLKRR